RFVWHGSQSRHARGLDEDDRALAPRQRAPPAGRLAGPGLGRERGGARRVARRAARLGRGPAPRGRGGPAPPRHRPRAARRRARGGGARATAPALKNVSPAPSPRDAITDYVFSARELPPHYPIPQHCEMSFTKTPPSRIFFHCLIPSTSPGGETPLVDFRAV